MNTADVITRLCQIPTRFRQLPERSRRLVVRLTMGTLVLVVAFGLWQYHVHHTPAYALQVVQEIKSINDLEKQRPFVTEKGYKVLHRLLEDKHGPSNEPEAKFKSCDVQGTACYFKFTAGTEAGYACFQQDGVWKFDDIVVTRHHGRDIELSLAYAIDHPYRAAVILTDWTAAARDIAAAFAIGWKIGAAVAASGS